MNTSSHSPVTDTFTTNVAAHRLYNGGFQQPLPYDDERDQPIAYTLTPAAHQVLKPGSRPQLKAVPPLVDDDVDRDPRRAQVKAMFRGGITPEAIATQLDIDLLLVRGWLELAPVPRRVQTDLAQLGETVEVDAAEVCAVHHRLSVDAQFAFVVGVLAATAEVDVASVTLTFTDEQLATVSLRQIAAYTPLADAQMHVIVRLSARSHGDMARSRWAEVLQVDPTQIRTVRGRSNPVDEVLIRIVHPGVAGALRLWCDEAVAPLATAVDRAF